MEDWKKANPGKPTGADGRAMVLRMNESHGPLREWAFAQLEWKPLMRILDIGCGGGAAIKEMLRLTSAGLVDGVDYSADCVEAAREVNLGEIGRRAYIKQGEVSRLPFTNAQYDLVTAIETVYFWPDLPLALSEILRVLKSGGLFAIILEVDGPERMNMEEVNFEMTVYRPEELVAALEQAGFLEIRTMGKENGWLMVTGRKS